ncbi:MAG: tetratricopeptide repeat protein [Halothece sp.]
MIINLVNSLSRFVLGVRVVDIYYQARQSKEDAKTAEKQARNKQLREAVATTRVILARWANSPSFWEKKLRQWLMGDLLEKQRKNLQYWQQKVNQANQIVIQAKSLEASDRGNPIKTEIIAQALALYQQCANIIHDNNIWNAISRCEEELDKRNRFQTLFNQGRNSAKQRYYKRALAHFLEAKRLFDVQALEKAIAHCQNKVKVEEKYEKYLNQSRQIARNGLFHKAYRLFKPVLTKYPRADGRELLQQLQQVIKGRDCFQAGVIAEQEGDLFTALQRYREANKILPQWEECQYRLAVLFAKNQEGDRALSYLERMNEDRAIYLRGYVYTQQGNYKKADREWQKLSHSQVKNQRQLLKGLVKRDRLLQQQKVEQAIDNNNLERAQAESLEFIQKFGIDPIVEENLNQHIQPRLNAQLWQTEDFIEVAEKAEKAWIEHQDIISLHNWAIATYYSSQIDSSKLIDFIIAWSTALANLSRNPILTNIPWLGNKQIDVSDFSDQLKEFIEKRIDEVKDKNIHEYFRLRDRYRTEMAFLNLNRNNATCGIKEKTGLLITPGCYQRYKNKFKNQNLPPTLWAALYTDWGLAVAACLEGDIDRAIEIKRHITLFSISSVEKFAKSFITYHQGYYYLQQNQPWQNAAVFLEEAKAQIQASTEWSNHIDNLCEAQRKQIDNLEEGLKFAQFWYNLLGSKNAKTYLAGLKAEEVRKQFDDKKITIQQALKQLHELQKFDPNNPIVKELIDFLDFAQEAEEIDRLMNRNQFSEAVMLAKRSNNQKIRFGVAKICIDILIESAESRKLPPDAIQQLGRWAYELCPNEPAFQEIYRLLRLRW